MTLKREELLQKLAALAIKVSLDAPLKFSRVGYTTYIQRDTVNAIREVLDDAGVEWRIQHKSLRAKTRK